jgi:hypothetical protein
MTYHGIRSNKSGMLPQRIQDRSFLLPEPAGYLLAPPIRAYPHSLGFSEKARVYRHPNIPLWKVTDTEIREGLQRDPGRSACSRTEWLGPYAWAESHISSVTAFGCCSVGVSCRLLTLTSKQEPMKALPVLVTLHRGARIVVSSVVESPKKLSGRYRTTAHS